MKKIKSRTVRPIVWVLVILACIITTVVSVQALASIPFDDYAVLDGNELKIVVKQGKNTSTATVRYTTGGWYIFPKEIGAADSDTVDKKNYPNYSGTKIDASFYSKYALALTATNADQTTDSSDPVFRYDTFTYPASVVMNKLIQWCNEGIFTRENLKSGITLYVSRSLKIIWDEELVFTGYNYPEIEEYSNKKHIGWGKNVWNSFQNSYDIELPLQFNWVNFSSRIVMLDAEGNQTDEESYPLDSFPHNEVFYGETITAGYPGDIVDYQYAGYELTAGGKKITGGAAKNVTYTANKNDINGNELVLTFKYKKAKVEIPFSTPTPEPTQAPGATATPTPTPTVTPTPAPPTPTSQPSINKEYMDSEEWYFTTDKGYYIGQVADSTTYKIATEASGTAGGSVAESTYTSRGNSFLVGYDGNGNAWYFIASGSDATYVHPKTYNGYEVDSADIKYITELVFPSTITYGGTTYTVTNIGGGTAKYKTTDSKSNYGNTSSTSYTYGTESGSYYWTYWSESTSQYTSRNRDISYKYGVIGNGAITSQGNQSFDYLNAGTYTWRDYYRYYYVYNTTLKKVVIPSTVTSILPYAFQYCQALETIEGGENLQTIGACSFQAIVEPKVRLSNKYKYSDSSAVMDISDYYYYNESYSQTDYTDIMLAWRESSYLCDEMIFPYLPKLNTINYSAFSGHYNLDEVDLSPTVSRIYQNAFAGCTLDRIRIPNASCEVSYSVGSTGSINENLYTLGTKGYDLTGNTTEIHCAADSTAMSYGLMYDGYYVLYCGYPVTYEPNGAPGSAQEVYSALNIHYGDVDDFTGTRLTYPNYKQSWSDQYSYSTSDCQYQSYLDKDGVLWLLDTTNKTMSVVSPGTTFTELFKEGAALFARDASGNLWVSGQESGMSTYTDSWGDLSYYTYYSDWFNWRKMTLPANTVKTQITSRCVFVLDADGVVWRCHLSRQNNLQVSCGDSPAFKDFWFTSYGGNVEENINSYMACLGTDGTLYYARESCYDDYGEGYFTTGFTLGSYLYAENWKSVTTTDGIKVAAMIDSYGWGSSIYNVTLSASGDLNIYSGTKVKQTISGYGFTDMEPYTVFGSDGAMLHDAAGNTYLLGMTGSSSTIMRVMMVASAGVEIKEVWCSYHYFAGSNYGCDYDDYDQYRHKRMYVWTDDGYLYAHSDQTTIYDPDYGTSNSTNMSNTSWRVADVKFKKIIRKDNYDCLFAIAEDGTLWSSGNNRYGQLGDSNQSGYSYGYEYPAGNTSFYLTKTSDRTYTDVYTYSNSNCWAIALGTDGKVYYSGYKPKTEYSSYYPSDGTVNTFTALGSEYTWPETASLPRLRTGFDYNTIIVSNPFAYDSYEFKGWNTSADGSGTAYYPGNEVALGSAITLYAQWGRSNNIIRYDRNGGSGTMANTVLVYDVTTTSLSPNKFAREGYEFAGWNTYANGSGTSYADGASITVAKGSATTLYAQWREIVTTYTLVYMKYPYGTSENTAWKSKTMSYKTVETVEGQPYTPSGAYTVTYNLNKPSGMSTVPTALDKTSDSTQAPTFSKWRLYTKDTAGEYTYSGRQYAQGATISQLTKENGGVVYLYPSWQSTGSYVILPYTEATGYVFEGWNEASDGSGALYPVYPPEDDENIGTYTPVKSTTLYGEWEPVTKNLTMDATNKAAAVAGMSATVTQPQSSVEVTFDAVAPDVSAPSCSRWVFMGYYTKLDAEGNPTEDSVKVYDTNRNADGTYATYTKGVIAMNNVNGTFDTVTTLYARWMPQQFEITLNDRGATSTNHTKTVYITYEEKGPDIITPTKTGYTFHGYYTGTYGTGTQYYDESGLCVKEWTELDKTEIYAYWIQDEVVLPEEGDREEPVPLPELDIEGTTESGNPKGLLYADDYNGSTDAMTDLQPYLTYDTGTSEGVIPGTEQVAFRAKMVSRMLQYKFHRNTGTEYVRYYVTVSYKTQYERSEDEELVISPLQTKTCSFVVPKIWSYWEIIECGIFYPDKVVVTNAAIKDGKAEVPVNRAESFVTVTPDCEIKQYGSKENHVFWEEYDTDGVPVFCITVAEEQYIISDVPDSLPEIEPYLSRICSMAVQEDTGEASVRSDRFILAGQLILSDEIKLENGEEINIGLLEEATSPKKTEYTSYLQTYSGGIELDEEKPNGKYATTAVITYIGNEANINLPDIKTVALKDVNDLRIHTPVACAGRITDGMEMAEKGYVLTVKEALNYFTLSVDNSGTHLRSLGYGEKDFSEALSGKSNIAEQNGKCLNQVQFPFDVYVDENNDSKQEGDFLLSAGTWLTVGKQEQQFYIPVTKKNGLYQIRFRTVAVNCPRDEEGACIADKEQYSANVNPDCYVAADVIEIEIKSYLRDFRITSVHEPEAEDKLENGCQALTLKKGYGFSFELLAQGEFYADNANVDIVPSFFFVSGDGTQRQEVKLYRLEEIPEKVTKECYAWEGEPLLLEQENYEVILQRFSGKGLVPADVLCVAKDFPMEEYANQATFTGREEFLLRDGYLVIHLDISVTSNDGSVYVFDKWQETELAEDAKTEGWNYIPGDIIRYDLSKSIEDDYEIGGSE